MKKKSISIFVLFLTLSSVVAISTDMKPEYEQGETMSIEISGQIIEGLNKAQIDFRRDHISVPFEFDLQKLEDKWFIWAITPYNQENYTLVIEDVAMRAGGNIIVEDFLQNFSVTGNVSDYNVKPGFLIVDEDFTVNVYSNLDNDLEIDFDYPEESKFLLKPGTNEIILAIGEDIISEVRRIKIGKYSFPVYFRLSGNEQPEENLTIRFNPQVISSTVLTSSIEETSFPFRVINFGKKDLEGLEMIYNKSIFNINIEERFNLEALNDKMFTLKIVDGINDALIERGIEENLIVKLDNRSVMLFVRIDFTNNESEAETPYLEQKGEVILYSCSELNGRICVGGETCSGETISSFEGACCLDKCIAEEENRSIIGWALAIIAILIVIFLIWRYKKLKKEKDPIQKKIIEIESDITSRLRG